MKTTLLSILGLITVPVLFGQNVNISDANFKAYLVGEPSINTNGDTEIQVSEAQAYSGTINCGNMGVTDMTGIEEFVNIDVLYCHENQLTSLDLSNNTALTYVNCRTNGTQFTSITFGTNSNLTNVVAHTNGFSSLDVSGLNNLTGLTCHTNQLSSLDVSSNGALESLRCYNNQLSSLDVSSNSALTDLQCQNNQLTSLNAANGNSLNAAFGNDVFIATNNPNLTCIKVDDVDYSTNNWSDIDATASFSENCSLTLENESTMELTIYPNPATDKINISSNQEIASVLLFDINGQLIKQTTSNSITVSELNPGIYLVQVTTPNGVVTKRIVKE